MNFFVKLMSDKKVEKRYLSSGASFGDAVSYIYMGQCVGFESMLDDWAEWEKEYSTRGYKTISIDDFLSFGGYGKSIDHLLGKKRKRNEKPILHAEIYRELYLGKIKPAVNLKKMMKDGKSQLGNYIVPTTKLK